MAHIVRYNLTLGTVLCAVAALVGPVSWWQLTLILSGIAFWDLGWHGRVHHPEAWFSQWSVIAAGAIFAVAGALLSLLARF